jgi:hypothetical protein
MSTLLELAAAFAAACERIATVNDLARGVCALVEPFGYHGVASGRLGRAGGPATFHFANWSPGWLEFYLASGFLRIDPVPLWALACGRPIGVMELRAVVPRGHPSHKVFDAGRTHGIGGGYMFRSAPPTIRSARSRSSARAIPAVPRSASPCARSPGSFSTGRKR